MSKSIRVKKIFDGKKITIRELKPSDIKNVRKFQDFINSLIEEDVMIAKNKKVSLKDEAEWLKKAIKAVKKNKTVYLLAEIDRTLVGNTEVSLNSRDRQSHVAGLGISIRKGYRRIGLGKYLMKEIIKLAKHKLKPKPKMIRLSAFSPNIPAIKLYQKLGFKKVAKIPRQFQYKGKLIDEVIIILEL
jgi:RimJ/RimL family protein N-acetyltransferase